MSIYTQAVLITQGCRQWSHRREDLLKRYVYLNQAHGNFNRLRKLNNSHVLTIPYEAQLVFSVAIRIVKRSFRHVPD